MRDVIEFNHISKEMADELVEELKKLYKFYHKKATCYRNMYKRLKKIKLGLNMASIGLTVIGGIAGGVTLNPILIGVLTGSGVMVGGYLSRSKINNRVNYCKFAYTSYDKILVQLRNYLRGTLYDETVFLSDVKVLDDICVDLCPPLSNAVVKKYENKYE